MCPFRWFLMVFGVLLAIAYSLAGKRAKIDDEDDDGQRKEVTKAVDDPADQVPSG